MSVKLNRVARKKGFTLIELLIVIGIIGILAAIVLVAVNPSKRLKQARDARRQSEVNALLNAILNYTVDNDGTVPSNIDSLTTNSQIIGTSSVCGSGQYGNVTEDFCDEADQSVTVTTCADLTTDLVPTYIASLPIDPHGTDDDVTTVTYAAARTGYYVQKNSSGRIEIGACGPENTSAIEVTR